MHIFSLDIVLMISDCCFFVSYGYNYQFKVKQCVY